MSVNKETDKGDVLYIHNGILLSVRKKEIMPSAATWIDLEIILSLKCLWSKSERERQISYDVAYMWNLKTWNKGTYLKNRNRPVDKENKLMVTKENSKEGW